MPEHAFDLCTELARRPGAKLGVRTLVSLHVACALEAQGRQILELRRATIHVGQGGWAEAFLSARWPSRIPLTVLLLPRENPILK